jgi:hypothetical protein
MLDEFVIALVQFAGGIVWNTGVDAGNTDEQRVLSGEVEDLGRVG